MLHHHNYMQRCLELAQNGLGLVAPNPMVGCVIVHDDKIIGEGYHHQYGGPHAEVVAVNSVKDKSLLKDSTIYVSLEPCSHHGKTPPCADMIVEHKIPRVVIGCIDSNPAVGGKGKRRLEDTGIEVITDILEKECLELNKRFFTHHNHKRPYIILKWAQSSDGFIDHIRDDEKAGPATISNKTSHRLAHKWRTEEQAILVGTNTAILDDPALTVRLVAGKNPLRIAFDRQNRLTKDLQLMDGSTPTLVFTDAENEPKVQPGNNLEYVFVKKEESIYTKLYETLYERELQSIIIEGGSIILNNFIQQNLWDEARVFISPQMLGNGIHAPKVEFKPQSQKDIAGDKLYLYRNHH